MKKKHINIKMGIVRKHFFGISLMMLLTMLVLGGFLYYGMPIYYNQVQKQEQRKDYLFVLEKLHQRTAEQMVVDLEQYENEFTSLYFSLSTAQGQILYPPQSEIEGSQIEQPAVNSETTEIGFWTDSLLTADGRQVILMGEYAYPSLNGFSQSLLTLSPFVIVVLMGTTIGAAAIYSRLSTKRIRQLSQKTRQITSLGQEIDFSMEGQDEIATLAQDIDGLYRHLLSSIQQLEVENKQTMAREQQKTDFLRMTAHELKTPITSMVGVIEGMMYGIGDFQDTQKYLRVCRSILQEQTDLVQSILEAASFELLVEKEKEIFSIKDLLQDMLPSYSAIATDRRYELFLELQDQCWIEGHKVSIEKALRNILDNAFRYTKPQGSIKVTLSKQILTIANEAEHLLNPEQLKQVFQPFYRPDFSRNKQDGGTGLGLYFVEQVFMKQGLSYRFTPQQHEMIFVIDFSKKQINNR